MARLGIAHFRSMSSLLFFGRRGKDCVEFTVKKCDGYMRKTLYIGAVEQCELFLRSELSDGDVAVEIVDSNKNVLCVLRGDHGEQTLENDGKTKYRVILRFDNATGKFTFGWKRL